MADSRFPWATRRRHPVIRAALIAVVVCLLHAPVQAEETGSLEDALLLIARRDAPLDERLAATTRVLESKTALDSEDLARAAAALMDEALEPAGWLALRAVDEGWISAETRARLVTLFSRAMTAKTDELRARACVLLAGDWPRGGVTELASSQDPFVRAVLERELPPAMRVETTESLWRSLGMATSDDVSQMRSGLDALVRAKETSVPFLLHFARQGLLGTPKGRMPRAARAILALGMTKDWRATPLLGKCLFSKDGWVRASAACALGDLGDPAGAVYLANYLATMGDLFRTRDQWDYPGASETSLTEAQWRQIDYFNVDGLAADALLRLGVPNAGGYLIHEKLDTSKQPYRIRVFQDAVDSLRRSLPASPWQAYNVDSGYPQREKAFRALARWWHAHRNDADLVTTTFDEDDKAYRATARRMIELLRGKDVRQFMIVKPACELLGRAATPVLIDVLATATAGPARSELATALGLVRDVRAIAPLLDVLKDKRPFVRAAAAKALVNYADDPRVVDALIATLADSKGGPRVAAMSALVAAKPSAAVLDAVNAHAADGKKKSADYQMAEIVVRLVQEGEKHWPHIEKGLADERRFTRERWWLLLRHALDLPAWVHSAKAAPDAPLVRRLSAKEAVAALKERRAR